MSAPLDFYAASDLMTDPGAHASMLDGLPSDIPALCRVVQGVLIHTFWIEKNGISLSSARKQEVHLRSAQQMLARIHELDERPLSEARAPEWRLVGNCRDFATLLCALLRAQGVPARARCGFATYLDDHFNADHWACEYWDATDARWKLVDAELDHLHLRDCPIDFDPCDVPRDRFIVAGDAWQACRSRQSDPRRFGFNSKLKGLPFIRNNLLRDLLALNKIETLAWDAWWDEPFTLKVEDLPASELARLDRIAALTTGPDESFGELRAAYLDQPALRLPAETNLRELAAAIGGDRDRRQVAPARAAGPLASMIQPADRATQAMGERPRRPQRFGVRAAISGVEADKLTVRGAHQHNLRNVDLALPRNKLIVLTGVSGSGKSSLAFDTIYAEGQRRYVESLSAYARQYVEQMEKPRVDYIAGLSPAISIEQRTVSKNPRSTVGTITEIINYLRLLFSRVGTRHCTACGHAIAPQSAHEIAGLLVALPAGTRMRLYAGRGPWAEDDAIEDLVVPAAREGLRQQLLQAVRAAFAGGDGILTARLDDEELLLTERDACPRCDTHVPFLMAAHFSPTSPFGMCPECNGLGTRLEVDLDQLVDQPHLSLLDGASRWYGNLRKNKGKHWLGNLEGMAAHYGVDLELPWNELPQSFRDVVLYGSGDEKITVSHFNEGEDGTWQGESHRTVRGMVYHINRLFRQTKSDLTRRYYASFMSQQPCLGCNGTRLVPAARIATLGGKTITEVIRLAIDEALAWVEGLFDVLTEEQLAIGGEAIAEVGDRLQFMINVGLHYLTLDRPAPSLSGGEGQRIRLASQIGSGLVGVLYILDEPSIGLHARDQRRLLDTLLQLRDLGNTVLVVEHDAETMRTADWLVDLGPGAGVLGGEVIAAGPPEVVAADPRSLTGRYLSGELEVTAPNGGARRLPDGRALRLVGARLHNLRDVTAVFPLGLLTAITGVSGSGKSSLISGTLHPALQRTLHRAVTTPGPFTRLEGVEHLDKVITITQDAIGRTPRSNPATYVGVFDDIRELFAETPEARARDLVPGHFSFNVPGGRCEACQGHGQKKIEMHFMADVWITCKECDGTRFSEETRTICYRGKNIADILEMDVREALEFFGDQRRLAHVLGTLHDVGLDYIKLGQSATTLSGGEAQRIKLATELSRSATGRTLYILDEPTTGLHFADIQRLLDVLHRLVDAGNTVIVIEHNLDVLKTADWIIDLGPEGGVGGGYIVAEGPPETVAQVEASHTGRFLREMLEATAA